MTVKEIVTLIQAVSENGLTSFEYTEGEQKLVLKKKKRKNISQAPVVISQPVPSVMGPMMTAPAEAGMGMSVIPGATPGTVSAGAAAPGTPAVSAGKSEGGESTQALDIGSDKVVTSPLVGTFYSSSSPDSAPFVQVGDAVKKGQVLGIIEAMKLMNEIESEYDGVVEAVLVGNEEVVEYGQPLFRIR